MCFFKYQFLEQFRFRPGKSQCDRIPMLRTTLYTIVELPSKVTSIYPVPVYLSD